MYIQSGYVTDDGRVKDLLIKKEIKINPPFGAVG